ncbi:hypothetical protein GFP93_22140 [Salmonella enterica]|uniref:hypothetical protein n=1 Tax=Salmonella enterica TaxID=28901 RepID=UPI000BA098C3|nr:hypothetical protein [Salmonella enterica]ECR5747706.1 hypothetical protein [Salmonella enterica subsp. enterica serovar Derby]EEA4710898.1 hypothetical protein [Salmonella enterica subsp. enterica serovar Give]EAQ7257339.1 hypothetical protein [Salmonella enterica]EBY9780989.1 hypothetical protein [Salmonella enterica subsp. enterica serovar Hato]EDY4391556.1 hypothetical protein [Salmonella enterica]
MAIFDIEKDELLRLSDSQLEELIARLSEAEVAAHGHSPAWVSWSGSINAPDGGIDIHVQVPADKLNTGFLERPDTILQAKKHSMPKNAITKEMITNGVLSLTITEQAIKAGSYIIVSLDDDCSPLMLNERLKAMQDAMGNDPNSSNIHLGFYDRSKLAQWLRQHPSVMLWVKGKLGQGYSGWQPYGAWSNPPQGVTDTLISAPGVIVSLPLGPEQKLNIHDAIDPIRKLIRSTQKAVRITGLSGVGKTRIVQALFDETVGTDALDRTIAVYVDTGATPEPSASAMLDRLIAEGQRAIMVLDNCPAELHSSLASKVSAVGTKVKLITVEYDIRDDKPQTTEVIHIEAIGPEVAEELLIRRFPSIGQANARRIAEFANGNARVALAIAERVGEGESLAQLSDAQLFNRLFDQRNHPDENLREQAEIMSLVYSFSISPSEVGQSELDVLGSFSGYTQNQLFRAIKKLSDRHVLQKRANWRAILPHAIANRLAASALESIPVDQLRTTFEATRHRRLLMSFAHRLGLLHNHPVAKEIAEAWLQPEGLLGQILDLDDISMRILEYIAPVSPDTLLDRFETVLTESNFIGMKGRYNPQRSTIQNLLHLLAYEPKYFERCIWLLIQIADHEAENNNFNSVRDTITRFFQPYLSGTHASLDQRILILNKCLSSDVSERKSLGLSILSTALDGPPWTGFGNNDFGARPRDYGFKPNYEELAEWRSAFIDITVELGTSGTSDLEKGARQILADKFQGIWRQKAVRSKLIDAARKLHAHHPWGEGWKAVRSTIYFIYTQSKVKEGFKAVPDNLAALANELEPNDLISKIMTYVLSNGRNHFPLNAGFDLNEPGKLHKVREFQESIALQLGQDFAASTHNINELGSNLFSGNGMPYRYSFGIGLAKGSHNLLIDWEKLITQLNTQSGQHKDFSIFRGFIGEAETIDSTLAQELLDQCAKHPELRHELVNLHPWQKFTEIDLDRCISLLDDPDIRPLMYSEILWREQYANLPGERILTLAQRLLNKPNGDDVVIEALGMRLHHLKDATDTLDIGLRLVGLKAAILRFQRDHDDPSGIIDHYMEAVVGSSLRYPGNEAEKLEWLNTIFAVVDEQYGYIHSFEDVIGITAALMPEAFLSRVFDGTEEQQRRRLHFIRYNDLSGSPISKIDIAVLIEWCRIQNAPSIWASVATGINLWVKDNDQDIITLPKDAMVLLEAAPDSKAVLESFAKTAVPSSWSGSLVNTMQPRVDAIGNLTNHERTDISEAAQKVYLELIDLINREKIREQREDKEREQRFE